LGTPCGQSGIGFLEFEVKARIILYGDTEIESRFLREL
jgi:hypothetical protein